MFEVNESLDSVIKLLPPRIAAAVYNLNEIEKEKITEIRLRQGRPVMLTMGENRFLAPNSTLSFKNNHCIIAESEDLRKCFINLCDNSVYSHEEEIKQGFISLKFGNRAGICGTIVNRPNGEYWIKDINAINIRIAHEIKGVAQEIADKNLYGGVLFCGPPHSGKTTYLRDLIRLLSDSGEKIGLIDSRGEIAAVNGGLATLDVGNCTDIMVGGRKEFSIECLLRTMAEDTIAFDEIGSMEELKLIEACFNAGVRIITSIHSASIEELIARNNKIPILNSDAFSHIIMLDKKFQYKIYKVGDIIA